MSARLLYSIPHAAEQLDCSRDHIYDLIAAGRLATVQLGTGRSPKTRVTGDSLQRLLQTAVVTRRSTR